MDLLQEKLFTYEDYMQMDDDARYELIDGVLYAMSPAPSWRHQAIGGEIFKQLAEYLKGKNCKVFMAPFDVRLDPEGDDDTVVQPDITVLCDGSKLDKRGIGGCNGVPDMVVEVMSPSTAKMDRLIKYSKYQKFGVREYWIVDLTDKTVDVNVLENGKYVKTVYTQADVVQVAVLDDCRIVLADVFAEE